MKRIDQIIIYYVFLLEITEKYITFLLATLVYVCSGPLMSVAVRPHPVDIAASQAPLEDDRQLGVTGQWSPGGRPAILQK